MKLKKQHCASGLRFIFTGGGSGGHVSPGLAVAAELKKRLPDAHIIYAGIRNKAEERMVPKTGIPLTFISSAPMPGKNPLKLFTFSLVLVAGILKALFLILKFRPHLVFATGGYVSAPVIFATRGLKKITFGMFQTKILIHESNFYPGKMNKMAARAADAVCVAFSETMNTLPRGNCYFSGYPVRQMAVLGDKHTARKTLGIPENAFTVFAFGGSQGSRTINRSLANAAPILLADPDIYVIHGSGRPFGDNSGYNGFEDVLHILKTRGLEKTAGDRYTVKDFIDNMGLYYAACDLVVIRAGAGSIMEVCTLGKPSIIIPISSVYSDHQTGNARYIESAGAAAVLYEKTDLSGRTDIPFLEPEILAETIFALKKNPEHLAAMSEKAGKIFPGTPASYITDHILFLCKKGERPGVVEKMLPHRQDRILGLDSNQVEYLLKKIKSGRTPPLDSDETKLLNNKINAYFTSTNPILRARALRIAGLAGYDVLSAFAVDCAVSLKEKPFVRRDAFISLLSLASCAKTDIKALSAAAVAGLSDPYYEARFCAARLAAVISDSHDMPENGRAALLPLLYRNLKDRCFEVRVESLLAAACIETDSDRVIRQFEACYYDPVWKVRKALFRGYEILVKRQVMESRAVLNEFEKILITSNGYTTEYELKDQFNKSRSAIDDTEVT